MDLDFTDEQDMLREMVRGVCAASSSLETVRALEDDPVGYSTELWKQLGELDLLGLMLPERVRRLGDDRARGRRGLRGVRARPGAVAPLRQLGDGRRACCCAPARRRRSDEWLPRIASGDAILTTAWLEPDGGFGPRGHPQRRRRPTATASCSTAPSGTCRSRSSATRLVVLARTGDAADGVDLFLVDPRRRGRRAHAAVHDRVGHPVRGDARPACR